MSKKRKFSPAPNSEILEENSTETSESLSNLTEDKHDLSYQKLVIPTSMRSIYWRYFGFPANENGVILTKLKIICILCKHQIKYNRNTSNLKMHLHSKHNQELVELEAENAENAENLCQNPSSEKKKKRVRKRPPKPNLVIEEVYAIDDGTSVNGAQFLGDGKVNLKMENVKVVIDSSNNYNINPNAHFLTSENFVQEYSEPNSAILNAIAEFVILDLQPPEIVEGHGFQKFVATLRSPCEIPSKNKLEFDILPKMYESYKESMIHNLVHLNLEIGLAIEEWISNTKETFVTFAIYYQNPGDNFLDYKVLRSMHAPKEWDEDQWRVAIDSLFIEWRLKIEKITAAVIALSIPELIAALRSKGLILIPCLLYSLQECALSCFTNPRVTPVLSKCRAIISKILEHEQASATLRMQDQILELEENSLVIDSPLMWITTYDMMEQIMFRKSVLSNILDVTKTDYDAIDLSENDWKLIENLIAVLEPFKITIITLSEEKTPLISILKPLLWQLVSTHLKIKVSDSSTVRNFKKNLSKMLNKFYADNYVTLLLQTATTLDPRFKQLPYATDEQKILVSTQMKDMLIKLIEDNGNVRVVKIDDISEKKKRRMSRMEQLLGNQYTKNRMPTEEKADLELVQYQSEAIAPLDHCPLEWWFNHVVKCPHLSKIAQKYNCVPACCPHPSRISIEAQLLYKTKRSAIPSHLADKLLFLHANYSLLE